MLKIVVKDYLPRSSLVELKSAQKPLRYKWLKSIVDAVDRLRADSVSLPVYKKAHCIITIYLPRVYS